MDHIVVSNKSVAKVYVKSSQPSTKTTNDEIYDSSGSNDQGQQAQYRYYFTIGNIDSFEEKLEEAQEALGIDPHHYVPVTYVSDLNWVQELARIAPSAILLGVLTFMGKKMQGGMGVGGPGGKGARGIFNIGKANITKLDKNAKNKVTYVVPLANFI